MAESVRCYLKHMNDVLKSKEDKMTTTIQTHEHNAMKPQPKWQDGSILVLAGILAGSEIRRPGVCTASS